MLVNLCCERTNKYSKSLAKNFAVQNNCEISNKDISCLFPNLVQLKRDVRNLKKLPVLDFGNFALIETFLKFLSLGKYKEICTKF